MCECVWRKAGALYSCCKDRPGIGFDSKNINTSTFITSTGPVPLLLEVSQEVLPCDRLVPLPGRFPIWSDLDVSGLLPSPREHFPFPLSLARPTVGNLSWPSLLSALLPPSMSKRLLRCFLMSCVSAAGVKIHRLH